MGVRVGVSVGVAVGVYVAVGVGMSVFVGKGVGDGIAIGVARVGIWHARIKNVIRSGMSLDFIRLSYPNIIEPAIDIKQADRFTVSLSNSN